ncbi:MAG: hypothetical protein QOJ49_677 [Actinomycetota bacterium]|nr:hypothetical protein [Actinomycetota bacterium]
MRSNGRVQAVSGAGLAGLVLVTVLAGCGGGGGGSGTESAAKPAARDAAGGAGAAKSDSAAGAPSKERAAQAGVLVISPRVLPGTRDIIYRGNVTVRVKDIAAAATRVEDLARGVNGFVFAEQTSSSPDSPGQGTAHLTLRVPPAEFSGVLRDVAAMGKRLSQSQTAEDVTGQVVDTQSRIATQKRSVARVRALLGQAKTIGEVVQVESELTRREADLESLQAQLAKLTDVTELATVDVELLGPSALAPAKHTRHLGFLTGLDNGWTVLVRVGVVALTIVGALLPFAIALGVVAVPAWLLLRPRLRRRTVPTAPPA